MTTLRLNKSTDRFKKDTPEATALAWLQLVHIDLFDPANPVPLEIGLQRQLMKTRPDYVSHAGIRRALYQWCHGPEYLRTLVTGAPRRGLHGIQGEVTEEQAALAIEQLQGRRLHRAAAKSAQTLTNKGLAHSKPLRPGTGSQKSTKTRGKS
jgi:sRNA-binding protein